MNTTTTNEQEKLGNLVINMLSSASENGLKYVYLRNYEQLPKSIGNDVDLLVYPKERKKWIKFIKHFIENTSLKLKSIEPYSCTSIFLEDTNTNEILHIDLFPYIEYHFLIFGSTKTVIENSNFNGTVYIPAICDELYINIMTRLIYHGIIREKHRIQWSNNIGKISEATIKTSFNNHFGADISKEVINPALDYQWNIVEGNKNILRKKLYASALIHYPFTTLKRFLALFARAVYKKILKRGNNK